MATQDERTVEFFFSPGSRYSYLAASQIPSIEAETGCVVDWRPADVLGQRSHRHPQARSFDARTIRLSTAHDERSKVALAASASLD